VYSEVNTPNHRRKRILRSSVVLRRPSGFIEPCLPSKVARPPSGPLWVHEIKHDGYRLMVRRDGSRVRCFTRNGHDWATASRPLPKPLLASRRNGEVVIARDDGHRISMRCGRRGSEAVLYAFDLVEHDGDDLRDLPLIDRKRRLARLLGRAKRRAIQFVEHLTGDGPTVFEHVCRMGLEGIVSKRTDAPYRSGPSKVWLKSKNPEVRRCAGSVRRSGTKPSLHRSRPSRRDEEKSRRSKLVSDGQISLRALL
jgi:bifunctional non-homologous end joining protein LigD